MKMRSYSDYDDMSYFNYSFKNILDKSLHTLEGIIKGIAIDGTINKREIAELNAWCSDYINISSRSPFKELIPLIREAVSDQVLTQEEIADILWVCNNFTTSNTYYNVVTADLQRLQGILHGILADNRIDESELAQLSDWIDQNTHLRGSYPYDEIDSIIISVLKDGQIDPEEQKFLKVFFNEFISYPTSTQIPQHELIELKKTITIPGICSVCPEIIFKNKSFCFTGMSDRAKRSEIAKLIEDLGGTFVNNVKQDLNYLVVGNSGNPCWAFSCYGRKVEQAITYRKKGFNIVIVNENDFWDAVE